MHQIQIGNYSQGVIFRLDEGKLWKDWGKITAEYGPFAYAQVRLSTERTNYIQIRCWSPEPEVGGSNPLRRAILFVINMLRISAG